MKKPSIADCLSDAGFSCKDIKLSDHKKLESGIKAYCDAYVKYSRLKDK